MMAHFAEIDEYNKVIRVLVTDNNDSNGDEGYQWLVDNLGGTWIKCSYNTREGVHVRVVVDEDGKHVYVPTGKPALRKNFPAPGYIYDPVRDAFYLPKPLDFSSWRFNEDKCIWEAPIPDPYPFTVPHIWDEENQQWVGPDLDALKLAEKQKIAGTQG